MMISEKRLPKTESYPCTRRGAKSAFDGLEVKWISFGSTRKHFTFDRMATHRPRIRGVVVASVSYSTQRESYVFFYVVRKAEYTAEAREDFLVRVLPRMRHWLERQIRKPDTAILGFEEMLVAWDGTTHKFHELTL
jgi:hypothetical protein